MKQRIYNGHPLEFYDDSNNKKAEIKISGSDLILNPVDSSGTVIIGEDGAINDIEVGAVGTAVDFTFLGGGTITSNGSTLVLGSAGDTVDLSNTTLSAVSASEFTGSYFGDGSNLLNVPMDLASYTGNVGVTGSLVVTGTITAQEFNTEIVSASILYESGSTKFGDTADDTHNRTGSLLLSGSQTIDGNFEVFKKGTGRTVGDLKVDAGSKYTYVGRLSSTSGDVSSFKVRDRLDRAYFDVNTASKYISFNPEIGNITMQIASGYGFKINTDQFIVSASGNVGIGTANPSFTSGGGLQISHATQANVRLSDTSNAAYNTDLAMSNDDFFLVNRSSAGHLKFRVNSSTEAITVLQDGKVGIGTPTPTIALHVSKSSGFNIKTERAIEDGGRNGHSHFYTAGNAHIFGRPLILESSFRLAPTTPSGTTKHYRILNDSEILKVALEVGGSTTADNILTVSGSNVGIGTASPSEKLDVAGTARMDTGITEGIHYVGTSVEHWGDGGTGMQFPANDTISLRTDSSDRLYINSTGNVGIGITSPTSKLHIYDNNNSPSGDITTSKILSNGNVAANGNTRTGLDVETNRSGWYNADATSGNFKISSDNRIGNSDLIGVKSLATVDVDNVYSGVAAGGSLTALYGKVTTTHTTGSGPVSKGYGLKIAAPEVAANSEIDTYYGASIEGGSVSGTLTNKYALVTAADAGNVGIGTTSPDSKLHLATSGGTTLTIQNTTNSGNASLHFRDEGDVNQYQIYYALGANRAYNLVNGNGLTIYSSQASGEIARFGTSTGYTDSYFIGDVGIGTDTPTTRLHIKDVDSPYQIRLQSTGTETWNLGIGKTGYYDNTLLFQYGGVGDKMALTSTGKLGVGDLNPTARLAVVDDTQFSSGQASVEVLKLQRKNTGGDIKATTEGHISMWATDSNNNTEWGRISWVNDNAADGGNETEGAMSFWTSREGTLTRAMYIDHDQQVGIGTDSPDAILDIENASGVTIDINSSSGDGQFRFQDNGTTKWSIGRDNTQQNFVFSNSAGLASDDVLTLAHSTGNVGIGTTTPSDKLEVAGNVTTQGGLTVGDSTADTAQIGLKHLLGYCENTDVDTGTEDIKSLALSTYQAVFFDYVIKNGTNLRAGTLTAAHDGTNIKFNEVSTVDLGNTTDVKLKVVIDGSNMKLQATTLTDNWTIKANIRGIKV